MAFDLSPLLAQGTPAPAICWTGVPRYNFTGGSNDPDGVPTRSGNIQRAV